MKKRKREDLEYYVIAPLIFMPAMFVIGYCGYAYLVELVDPGYPFDWHSERDRIARYALFFVYLLFTSMYYVQTCFIDRARKKRAMQPGLTEPEQQQGLHADMDHGESTGTPKALIVLIASFCLFVLVNTVGLFFTSGLKDNIALVCLTVFVAFIAIATSIVIVAGLYKRQQWAWYIVVSIASVTVAGSILLTMIMGVHRSLVLYVVLSAVMLLSSFRSSVRAGRVNLDRCISGKTAL